MHMVYNRYVWKNIKNYQYTDVDEYTGQRVIWFAKEHNYIWIKVIYGTIIKIQV